MKRNLDLGGAIVVLTGAGVSQESGLATFRDKDGIWSRVSIEEVATPEAFRSNPKRVHAFYNERRRGLLESAVKPNAAHQALANLERSWPGGVLLVTQNIDDLHERAGSRALRHMHGELLKARCLACGDACEWRSDIMLSSICPACGAKGRLRVDVVWFGEMPYHMDEIFAALAGCALFVAIGTSGSVYPAAGFVEIAGASGAHTVELNLDASEGANLFTERRYGPASRLVPEFVAELIDRHGSKASA